MGTSLQEEVKMSYTFLSTEEGPPRGNATETCALLHLMCYSDDRNKIEQFAIDCFNDVTGMDGSCFVLYDIQSKVGRSITPAKLGEYLATLFENSVSDFARYFATFTLFIGGTSPSVLDNPSLTEFGFLDMQPKAQASVKKHLAAACKSRHGGAFSQRVTDENVDAFLSQVRFVVAKEDPVEYIRTLAHTSSALLPDDRTLKQIFAQIRDTQSSLKNRTGIAGKSIERPDEIMDYGRTMKWRDIKLLIIERLLNRDFYKDEVPDEFMAYLQELPPEEVIEDVAEDCRNEMFAQYFDKNDRNAFWTLFDEIVTILEHNPDASIKSAYGNIDVETLKACRHMGRRSKLYFIAIIKDGLRK